MQHSPRSFSCTIIFIEGMVMVGFLHNNGIGAKEARRAWTLVFCTMLSEEQI
jgi:hypothetical protein